MRSIIVGILLATTCTAQDPAGGTVPGRYTIITNCETETREKITIRLDTATGQTWELRTAGVPVKDDIEVDITGWTPLSEDLTEDAVRILNNVRNATLDAAQSTK